MAFNPLKGIAQSITGRVLRKVSGTIPILLGITNGRGSDFSDFAPLSNEKRKTKMFQFPLDVSGPVGTGNQGHYIMFMINQQQNAKLGFGNAAETNADGSANMQRESKARKIPTYLKELTSGGTYAKKQNNSGASSQLNSDIDPTGGVGGGRAARIAARGDYKGKGSTISVQRPATVRMDTAITLYMPQIVGVTYGVDYADQEVGDLAAAGANIYNDIMESDKTALDVVNNGIKQYAPELADSITNSAIGLLSVVPGLEGARDRFQAQRGYVKAPKMELFFRGIGKRKFQYTFKMIPRNQQEMQEIRKIVASFKLNMLPEFVDGNRASRRLTVPNTFDIQYMYNGKENDYLHKISTCVLENMNVSYSGEGKYQTFTADDEGAPPLSTEITLNFQEMEIITKERVAEGF